MKSELIADFANHADFYVGNEHSDKSYEEKQRLWTEKLVELVVRECMKESWEEIVDDEDIAEEPDPLIREYLLGNNQGIVDAVIKFRNHFGVEE